MKLFEIFTIFLLTLVNYSFAVWETLINNSLTDYQTFEKYWNYLYPWGSGMF